MFTAALITEAKIWKQPKSLLMDEWIKKIWYLYRERQTDRQRNSAIKNDEMVPFVTTQMDLESII